MTEIEWLRDDDMVKMLDLVNDLNLDPELRMRLWAKECLLRWELFQKISPGQKDGAFQRLYDKATLLDTARDFANPNMFREFYESERAALLRDVCGNPLQPVASQYQYLNSVSWHNHAHSIRDNYEPLNAHIFKSSWVNDTARDMAVGMIKARDFSGMPMLADVLEENGCTINQVLEHCRQEVDELVEIDCPTCGGSGEVYGAYWSDDGMGRCEDCHGRGTMDVYNGPHCCGCWVFQLILGDGIEL